MNIENENDSKPKKATEVKKCSGIRDNKGKFVKGSPKLSNSGRKKGVPNKRSANVANMIAEKYPNYDPVCAMIELGLDPETPRDIQLSAHREVAKYVYPQLKAIEHKIKDESTINNIQKFADTLRNI